jgi:hypothetical protein
VPAGPPTLPPSPTVFTEGNHMIDESTVSHTLESFKVTLGMMMALRAGTSEQYPYLKNRVWQMAYVKASDQLNWLLDIEEELLSDEEAEFLFNAHEFMAGESLEILLNG